MRKDLSNKRFGRWVVIEFAGIGNGGGALWKCLCDCGSIKTVYSNSLRFGRTHSCGCLSKELHTVHGYTNKPEYKLWISMRQRCTNPKNPAYKYYGGRGIKVSDRWNKFKNFIADMGPRPDGLTLDRINNDGNYEPENCQWTTQTQQTHNSRIRKTNKTGVKGVYWNKKEKKYQASIGIKKQKKHLGLFTSLADAKIARQKAEAKYWKQVT